MKKALAVAVMLCFASTCFAAWGFNKKADTTADTKTEAKAADKDKPVALIIWTGKVVSVNEPQNELVIKESKTTYDKVLIVVPDTFKKVKLGDEVQVTLEPGNNIVKEIKVTKAAPVEKPVVPAPVKKKK